MGPTEQDAWGSLFFLFTVRVSLVVEGLEMAVGRAGSAREMWVLVPGLGTACDLSPTCPSLGLDFPTRVWGI